MKGKGPLKMKITHSNANKDFNNLIQSQFKKSMFIKILYTKFTLVSSMNVIVPGLKNMCEKKTTVCTFPSFLPET